MDIKNNEYYLIKISEFLDGELSAEETRELFVHIADSPELQEELKTSMAVRNMFHQELIPPPKQAKIFLYGKLNLQKTAVVLSFLISVITQFRKILLNPAVGATLLGLGIFLLGYFSAEYVKNQNLANSNKTTQTNLIAKQVDQSIPVVSSKEIASNPKSIANINKPIALSKTKFSNQVLPNITNSFQSSANFSDNEFSYNQEKNLAKEPHTQDFERMVTSTLLAKANKNVKFNIPNETYPEFDYLISSFLDKMSIAITKSNNNSNIKTNLEPLSNPMLNDYSVAIAYNINEQNALAIEFGQENYAQRFSGIINQSNAIINQVYTAQWYGFSYQYNFDKLSNQVLVNPFFKVLAGVTKIGPMFKGSFGLGYSVNDKLILNAGLEASTLIYEFQGNRFNTNKYGFFYGAKLNF